MNFDDPALTFALALAAGVLAQAIARHLRVPGIILLLATGVALGPELLNIVRPEQLGDGLLPIVGLAVAVILFEGGLQLNIGRLRREATVIRRLITIGALVTITGATVAAQLILGWSVEVAILFGTLVSVTGPTVINPLTRRIGLRQNLRTILEAEGVLIDPIGAILAVVALEVVVATAAGDAAAQDLLGLPGRLGLGAVIGVVGGFAIAGLLRLRKVVPTGFENIFTLATVLALFQASNAILPESGIMTVAIAGLVVGNLRTHRTRELVEFKEQLTTLLVGLLFVLLAAAVRIEDVFALGWAGVGTALALMFLVRPLDVAICTWGQDYSWQERSFIAWMGPRGIVAFAISSLFAAELAHYGMPDEGVQLRALVFLVIAMTVIVQGGTAGLLAGALGVKMERNNGFVLAGANSVARALAKTLREAGGDDLPVILVDTNAGEARQAEKAGFRVIFGNASDERTLLRASIASRRAFVALTPNDGVNLLLSKRVHEMHREISGIVAISRDETGVSAGQVHDAEAAVLFGHGIDFERWAHFGRQDRIDITSWTYDGKDPVRVCAIEPLADSSLDALALVAKRGKWVDPVHERTDSRTGDTVWFASTAEAAEALETGLRSTGWVKNEPAEAD